MLKSHDKFHSAHGKRLILVADDEAVNRELLGAVLQSDYEVIYACDGQETVEQVKKNRDELSLVLLDLMMPVKPGLEALRELKADPALKNIPVIVLTADQDAEIESLSIGAVDYIPKPYPQPGIILARILKAIELYEDREIIRSTERDPLTGLYNREYFYRYCEQYDQHHREVEMDCIVLDVNHFHMINERFGTAYGDELLRRIGEKIRESVAPSDGIVCRRSADTFMVYCPHGREYKTILENAAIGLTGDESVNSRVRLRMGVYANADKSMEIERRFDRAKMAADTVRNSFTKTIGIYDSTMHERELYAEQLIDDFQRAIDEKQFKVYYQPKFDIRPDVPVLSSAEALVRWQHPRLGLISPGVFIPLFEDNGLIQELDSYVWRETAAQIRDWKERLGFAVPISANVSRIDMYDAGLVDKLSELLRTNGLESGELLLEITESAYTQDSEQIIETVNRLRALGFKIEMDDFGTGYSSLNMISSLPVDALKLDMQFVRSAFKDQKDTRMLEVIIDIADRLDVPVIAEGVETEEQLLALKDLGCDIIQGYYFSKPVPDGEFEVFLRQRTEERPATPEEPPVPEETDKAESGLEDPVRQARIHQLRETAFSSGDGNSGGTKAAPAEDVREHTGFQLKTASIFFVVLALIAAAALLFSDLSVTRGYQRMENASDRYISAQMAATDLESASDYLTDRVRCFVVTGERKYLEDFFEEVNVTRRRDGAVEKLEALLKGNDSTALANLSTALDLSNELVLVEDLAMRLTVEAGQYSGADIPQEIAELELPEDYRSLSPEQMHALAENLVFDNNYMHYKDRIRENVSLCTQALIRSSSQELEQASAQLAILVRIQTGMTILFLLIVLGIVAIITQMIRKPLTNMVQLMQEQKIVPPTGVEELRFVTRTYNKILQENEQARERLSHEASHDALTGLFNRGAYDLLMESADTGHMALLLVDVDNFKGVNDTYGHAVGDKVLKRVADILRHNFRSVDILCRLGGDEFAVVMTRADSSMRQLVLDKITRINDLLQHPKDELPPVSLSVGVAFSDRENPQGDIFKDADTALYRVKDAGRAGCAIYE